MNKVSDEQIIEAYGRLGNVWKVGEELGIAGQTAHARLKSLGLNRPTRGKFSEEEIERIKKDWSKYADAGNLDALCAEMKRTKPNLCRKAAQLGLTDRSRTRWYWSEPNREKMIKWHKENEHPRGALGMKHTDETKKKLSMASKKTWMNMSEQKREEYSFRAALLARSISPMNRDGASWKASWQEIGGKRKYFRSRWESNYARYLQFLKETGNILEWEHEPKTFWFDGIKRGCMSYLPDFSVTELSGKLVYHEVKGWMDDRSKTKIRRMAKYHPKETLIVIDSKAYKALANQVSKIVPGWE